MSTNSDLLKSLHSTLSHFEELRGSTIVIKYGGAAMKEYSLKLSVMEDINFLYSLGVNIIFIHGGGPEINHWLEKLNIVPQFKDGLRITDKATMEIVEMVLSGKINKEIVSLLNKRKQIAIGISGKDGNLIEAKATNLETLGYVGEVHKINTQFLTLLLETKYVPIIASIGNDIEGESYNINADILAGAIATKMKADKLILLTDTKGILEDRNSNNSTIKHLNIAQISELCDNGKISEGMLPKVNACTNSLREGVSESYIINGQIPHAIIKQLFHLDLVGSVVTY